jgi:hypothetical protein
VIRWSAVLAGLVVCAACATCADEARAQGPDAAERTSPAARAHLEAGLRHFEAADYAAAIREFEAGYRLEPHADFLYALGQAQRLGGKCRDAVSSYRAFLRSTPPEEEADLARSNLEKCEATLREEDEARQRATSASPPLRPPPQQASPPPPPPERAPFYTDWLGDVLTGAGIVGLALGGTFWGLALDRASSADDGTFEDYERAVESARELRAAAVVAGLCGVGFVGAGIIRFATRPDERRSAGVSVTVAPAGGRVVLRAPF